MQRRGGGAAFRLEVVMLYFAAVLVVIALVAARDRGAKPERANPVFRLARSIRRRPHLR
jgi:hypothetical protein